MNTYLFDIVHDILTVNFDIANDNVINANALNLLKSSLVGESFIQNPNMGQNLPFERKGARKVTFTVGTELNQKIIKIVSKKNMNIKNSFVSPNSFAQSMLQTEPNGQTNKNQTIVSNNPEANIALINKIKSQESEKSASKLQMIRNVLINEIKETDAIKNNVKEFKDYVNDIINLNINFFNQKILKGTDDLCLVTKTKVIKDSVDNLQNNMEDDNNTEYIAIETNIAIKNNKVENIENTNKEEKKPEVIEQEKEDKPVADNKKRKSNLKNKNSDIGEKKAEKK